MGGAHRKPARKRRGTGAPAGSGTSGGTSGPTPTPGPTPAPTPAPARSAAGVSRRRDPDERPKPPWHPFPLIELCVLVGMLLIVLGFIRASQDSGKVLLLCGLVLASLAGLDTAVREHFAGFRSHSLLLAGMPAVLVAGGLFFAQAPWLAIVIAAPLVCIGAFIAFRAAFRRVSGGLSFKA